MKDRLNPEQRDAVTSTEGFVRVIAGAGSGKTRALSHRFAYLVNEVGILPGNILCVTFTNKAANEMRERFHRLTGDNDTGYVNTFHGFCVSVLGEDSHAVSYPKSFLVLDNADIDAMLAMIYEERGLTLRDMTYSDARDMIEMKKIKELPDYYLDLIDLSPDALKEKYLSAVSAPDIIFYGYLYQEKKCFGLDYNDLIILTLYIFEQNAAIREKWQKRLEYIMIDEFQDIDALQYRLMTVLCDYHKNLFIVGDPDQTIYTWRGANQKFILEFDKHFPGTKTILMNRNYRSTPEIIRAVNSLIDKNAHRIKKDLLPTRESGKKVLACYAQNAEEEARFVAKRIERMKASGISYRDIAVLYRAHYVTRPAEEVFIQEEIPYTILSGISFFERMEVKDTLSYLRMIAYRDDLSFLRIANRPKRNLGEKRMKVLKEYAESNAVSLYDALKRNLEEPLFKSARAREFVSLIERFSQTFEGRQISEVLAELLDESGYEAMLRTEGSQERLDNLAELRQSVYDYETSCGEEATLYDYLSHVALYSSIDCSDRADKVKLMTVHAAKGLEFPHVILIGMNEGVFPSRKIRTLPAMEEERRLAFVAMTRAEDTLTLTGAEGWNFDDSARYPSRFIIDVDPALLSFAEPLPDSLLKETAEYVSAEERLLREADSFTPFPPGKRVKHSIFGSGTVLEIDTARNAHIVKFDGIDTPRAIRFQAKLTEE